MTEQIILEATKDWGEPEIAHLMRMLNLRRDPVTRMWDYTLGKTPTFYERDQTTILIQEYGYEVVKKAFGETGLQPEKGKHGLPYIRAILKKQKQEESIKKEKALQALKLKEVAEITGEPLRRKTDLEPKWKPGMFDDILKK